MNNLVRKLYRLVQPYCEAYMTRSNIPTISQQTQKVLLTQWLMAKQNNIKLFDNINHAGFRCYSQFEEDGIILYLFALIGIKNKTVVELGCGIGRESMAANLIVHHSFDGYLYDGNREHLAIAKNFYNAQKECYLVPPTIKHVWMTKDNINHQLQLSGLSGEVDLLVIDVDGIDYYLWEAIDVIKPRLCVFEVHNTIPTELSLTIPYDENFSVMGKQSPEQDFRSASLAAINKLSTMKGYTLVGANHRSFNVFYVRNDLLNELLPRPTLQAIYSSQWVKQLQAEKWPTIKDFPWLEV